MAAAEAVEGAADALEAESVRVCELAEELGELAEALANGWGQREAKTRPEQRLSRSRSWRATAGLE